MSEKILFDFLNTNNIGYTLFKHQPVFTTQDIPVLIDSAVDEMPGTHSKNLFLKDEKDKFFLVSVTHDKRVDLKALSKTLNCARLSFGKAPELLELLRLSPGSVTPFGLMFDTKNQVTFVLDQDFLTPNTINFHPLRNDMTLNLTPQAFITCMEIMGHKPLILAIPIIS